MNIRVSRLRIPVRGGGCWMQTSDLGSLLACRLAPDTPSPSIVDVSLMRKTKLPPLKLLLGILVAASSIATVWLDTQHQQQQQHEIECQERFFDCARQVQHLFNESLTARAYTKNDKLPSSEQKHPNRILLGIGTTLNLPVSERQRRHLVRNTYLDFDRLHRPNLPNRACSLNEFLKDPELYNQCKLIYTFVLGPEKNSTLTTSHEYLSVLDPSLFDNHEKDVLYLNVNETDGVAKRWAWLRYGVSETVGDQSLLSNVDFVAFTDAHVLLKPTSFWTQNDILSDERSGPSKGIYAGLPTQKSKCIEKKCRSLQGDALMRRWVMLSTDLVRLLAKQDVPTLPAEEAPDVAIANALHSSLSSTSIKSVPIEGLVAKVSKNDALGDYLNVFDRYKDGVANYDDHDEESRVRSSGASLGKKVDPPRIFLGIMTMDAKIEQERRNMIRRTYLSAFRDSETPLRICSLPELEAMENERLCQMTYAFIMGGNPDGPTELVDITVQTGPLTISPTSNNDEPDIVHLNIRENGKEGKSQTFFKFATTLLDKHYFDYLAKIDTDTVLYPKLFLEKNLASMPKFPNNMRVYAGDYRIKPSKESLNLGPAYMGGHFYMMSPDLARFITSPACNRSALAVYSEDQSIGNFIHSMAQPIRRLRIMTFYYDHPVKRVDRMRTLWRNRQSSTK